MRTLNTEELKSVYGGARRGGKGYGYGTRTNTRNTRTRNTRTRNTRTRNTRTGT